MPNPQLVSYIKSQLQRGKNQEAIKNTLLDKGWMEEEVNEAFSLLEEPQPPNQTAGGSQDNTADSVKLIPRLPPQQPLKPKPPPEQQLPSEDKQEPEDETQDFIPGGSGGKKWLLALLGVILLISASVGSFFYFFNQQKTEIKKTLKKQTENFSHLETIYAEIVKTIKEAEAQEKDDSQKTDFLKTSDKTPSDVLGLEEEPVITAMRKLDDLYKQGETQTEEIDTSIGELEEKTQKIPFNLFLPQSKELAEKTRDFTEANKLLFDYLVKANQLDLKLFTVLFEIFVALDNVGPDEASLKLFEKKIKSLDELQKEYEELETSSLPKEVYRLNQKTLEDLPKVRTAFLDIANTIKTKNLEGFLSAIYSFRSLLVEQISGSEVATVEIVSFWQDRQTESAKEIKKEWGKFSQKF